VVVVVVVVVVGLVGVGMVGVGMVVANTMTNTVTEAEPVVGSCQRHHQLSCPLTRVYALHGSRSR
jgi:hypothetical protein